MTDHSWTCPACHSANAVATEACRECGARAATAPEPGETFFASRESPLAKARIYVFAGLAAGFAMVIVKQGGFSSDLLLTLPILLLFALPVWLHFRNQLRFGQAMVTLSDEAIEAPNLAATEKTLRWADVDAIALDLKQLTPVLAFHLKELDGFRQQQEVVVGKQSIEAHPGIVRFLAS
jgi:hypothetical protein